MNETDPWAGQIIWRREGVQRQLGPGLFGAAYEAALAIELERVRLGFRRPVSFPDLKGGKSIGEYRVDLRVEEIKSVERFDPVLEAQGLTHRGITGKRMGLLINCNSHLLRDGVKRFIL